MCSLTSLALREVADVDLLQLLVSLCNEHVKVSTSWHQKALGCHKLPFIGPVHLLTSLIPADVPSLYVHVLMCLPKAILVTQ